MHIARSLAWDGIAGSSGRVAIAVTMSLVLAQRPGAQTVLGDEPPVNRAEDAGPGDSDGKLDLQKHKRIADVAGSYKVYVGRHGRDEAAARLAARPLLRWTNPVEAATNGAVFLWMSDQGRPAAMACLYEYPQRIDHEFVSLSVQEI